MDRINRSVPQEVAVKTWGSHKTIRVLPCLQWVLGPLGKKSFWGELCPDFFFYHYWPSLGTCIALCHLTFTFRKGDSALPTPCACGRTFFLCLMVFGGTGRVVGFLSRLRTRRLWFVLEPLFTRRGFFPPPAVPLHSHMYMCVCMYYLCNNSLERVHALLRGVVCSLAIPLCPPSVR